MIRQGTGSSSPNSGKCIYDIRSDLITFPDQWFLDEPRTVAGKDIDAREFTSGIPYLGPLPAIVPIQKYGREVEFHLAAFEMPVVSMAVANTICRLAPGDVQCFPIEVPGAAGSYQILNAVYSLNCLDEDRSEFTRWQPGEHRSDLVGQYRMISTIRVNPAKTSDHHVFRIKNWNAALLVSGIIKDALGAIPQLGVAFSLAS